MPDLCASRPHRDPPVGHAERIGRECARSPWLSWSLSVLSTAGLMSSMLRRAAMYAAEDAAGPGPGAAADRGDAAAGPLTVRDAHMTAALDELLDSRNQLTRALLGGHAAQGSPASPNLVTP